MTNYTWIKVSVALIFVSAAIGAYFGHKAYPTTVVHETVKTQVETQQHIVTQTKTIYLKDGTKTVDIVETADVASQSDIASNSSKSSTAPTNNKKWLIIGAIGVDNSLQHFYSIAVEKQVFGSVYVGVAADTQQRISINIGVGF